jgi:hypothetical protein
MKTTAVTSLPCLCTPRFHSNGYSNGQAPQNRSYGDPATIDPMKSLDLPRRQPTPIQLHGQHAFPSATLAFQTFRCKDELAYSRGVDSDNELMRPDIRPHGRWKLENHSRSARWEQRIILYWQSVKKEVLREKVSRPWPLYGRTRRDGSGDKSDIRSGGLKISNTHRHNKAFPKRDVVPHVGQIKLVHQQVLHYSISECF